MNELRLRSPDGELEAVFVPEAGLVGASLTHRGEELLAQRKGLEAYAGSGSTFGIPLLHPWANRLGGFSYAVGGQETGLPQDSPLVRLEEHDLPIHGLAPYGLHWEVTAEEPGRVAARVDFGAERLELFPFPHRLEAVLELAEGALTVQTTLVATGAAPVPVAFGYHPYLALPGVARAEWEVVLPVEQRLLVDENAIPTGALEPADFTRGALGDRSLDEGYVLPERPGAFTVSGGGRTLGIEMLEGYTHAQVFAPEAQDLICFEPMTAPADALRSHEGLRLAPAGEPFTAAFRITVDG